MWLLFKSSKDGLKNADENIATYKKESETVKSWTRREMLRHWRFYLIMPAVIAPSFIGTALFFHHLTLADAKGWSAIWITGSYWVYAVGSVAASLFFGPLIDRISAVKAVPLFLIPKNSSFTDYLEFFQSLLGLAISSTSRLECRHDVYRDNCFMGRIIWPQTSW